MRISDWSSDVCSSDLENAKRSLPVGHVVGLLELAEGERRRIDRAASGDIAERHGAQPPRALGGGRTLEPVGGVGGILPAPFVEKLLPKRLARSDENTSELQSPIRISYAFFSFKNI